MKRSSRVHKLTKDMIYELPACDIHVHLPGTISAKTAYNLGLNNGLMSIEKLDGLLKVINGPKSLSVSDPHEHYLDIFKKNFYFDNNGALKNLEYHIDSASFKSFDRVMATVQGHRHPPGGIQKPEDIMFVLEEYLKKCLEQKIFYTEVQQNIKIAYLLFPNKIKSDARKEFFLLLKKAVEIFENQGVILRFLHCFNKTTASFEKLTTHERTIESASWLKEAEQIAPGVFVGIESAGHEKDETGWPVHLKAGYEKVKELGLGCEAHGGEGIGVEHMIDVIETLPITRLAHGFQIIEDLNAIEYLKKRDLTLVMMPIINLNLGLCVHKKKGADGKYFYCSKTKGGEKSYIADLYQHPFFELFRKHKLKITLGSDNPEIAGLPLKSVIVALAGLDNKYPFENGIDPLNAEELAILCINGVNAIFSKDKNKIKNIYKDKLSLWIEKFNLNKDYIKSYYNVG